MNLELSAVDQAIIAAGVESPRHALAEEIKFNLQHQHRWSDLQVIPLGKTSKPQAVDFLSHSSSSTTTDEDGIYVIKGLPPKHIYIHPDLQNRLIKRHIPDSDLPIQYEWVLPLSIGETATVKQFARVVDSLPQRQKIIHAGLEWQDSRRVLLAMLAHNGMGGDGTVTYYIMQDGEVKPRQNG